MKQAIYRTLTESEMLLVADTSRDAMADLDEDQLLELLTRVRRARTKYVTLYRRRGSAQVIESGGRGLAHPINQRNRDRAEVFERALARVSRQVQISAKQAADELRTERLEAARSVPGSRPSAPRSGRARSVPAKGKTKGAGKGKDKGFKKTTGGLKKDASTRASGARRQAKRDSR